jgi:hypothetical protein
MIRVISAIYTGSSKLHMPSLVCYASILSSGWNSVVARGHREPDPSRDTTIKLDGKPVTVPQVRRALLCQVCILWVAVIAHTLSVSKHMQNADARCLACAGPASATTRVCQVHL